MHVFSILNRYLEISVKLIIAWHWPIQVPVFHMQELTNPRKFRVALAYKARVPRFDYPVFCAEFRVHQI